MKPSLDGVNEGEIVQTGTGKERVFFKNANAGKLGASDMKRPSFRICLSFEVKTLHKIRETVTDQ